MVDFTIPGGDNSVGGGDNSLTLHTGRQVLELVVR